MVQIPTRTRTLSFSVREAGMVPPRTRPLDPLARGDEPDAKRARQSYAPIRVPRTATPLAPKSVNLTVTAVPFPTDAQETPGDTQWGTSALPSPSSSSAPRQKRLVARTISAPSKPAPVVPPPPPPAACTTTPPHTTRARRPSPLAPYWNPPSPTNEHAMVPIRTRRGRLPPEPLARKALKAHFARTPHGAAVVKLGARRAIAQAECVAAVERVRRQSSEKSSTTVILGPRRGTIGPVGCPGVVLRPQLLPPVVMVEPPRAVGCPGMVVFPSSSSAQSSPPRGVARFPTSPPPSAVRFPTSPTRADADDGWVPLSVQPAPMEVEVEECDIVEMEVDGWARS